MESDSSRRDNQESKLQSHGESSKPDLMQLHYLKEITNNFSDERILGRGGFGVVYKGVLQNGNMVAIKKLMPHKSNSLKQFENELGLLMRLEHPNIVQLTGYCYEIQHEYMYYNGKSVFAESIQTLLCLEYLPKGSLDQYISDESHRLDWRTRYKIIEGICHGLQYLHEQAIIHMDLKPANILLTGGMVPKVTDFGLSKLLGEEQTMSTTNIAGTRGYMPPEYIYGGKITKMSDIFSLGIIILELVTGHKYYPGFTMTSSEDNVEHISQTLEKWRDVLTKSPGSVLERDCQQIKKCFQVGLICINPKRTKRPTAAEVIKMLQELESVDCHGGSEVKSTASQAEAAGEEVLKDDVYTAAAYGDLEKLQRLVEAEGQPVTEPDGLGYHALQWAALNNRVAVAHYIHEHGADVNAVDHTGQTALHWSSVRGHVEVAELLLKEGANVDTADLYGYQAAHVAAQYGQTTFIRHLVEKCNANPDVPDNDGRSPLHWAAYKGFADCTHLLLDLDTHRLRQDKHGCTPLHWAAVKGNMDACIVLVEAGKKDDLMVKDRHGFTPAQLAADKRYKHLARYLAMCSYADSRLALAAPIDTVKQRMEAAYKTLQNAAGIDQLSQGDLPETEEILATMRHCLSAGGEVAEFANMRWHIKILEEWLHEFSNHEVGCAQHLHCVQHLRCILGCIRKFNSWKVRDTKIHVKPLKELWEDFEVKQRANRVEMMKHGGESISSLSFSSWLPSFYYETVLYLEQEWDWCSTIFPGEFRSLVPTVLIETMVELSSSFVSHLNEATGDVPETRYVAKDVLDVLSDDIPKSTKLHAQHLVALIELHKMTDTFARSIQYLFSESDREVLLKTVEAIYFPYQTFKVRYVQMECAVLSVAMAGIDIGGAISRGSSAQGLDLSETVHRMNGSIPQMIAFLDAAVERCVSLTGGSEADELVLVLDDIMVQYISNLEEFLKSLRTVCMLDNTADSDASKNDAELEKEEAALLVDVSEEEELSIVQGALQVLTVAECLTISTLDFEASLKATLVNIGTQFSLSRSDARMDMDIATIRLTNLPDKSKKLFAVLERSTDQRFQALPVTSQRVAAFSDKVNEFVYDVLISKVQHSFSEIARLPIWSSVEEQGNVSFTVYPQEYVTSVGGYLRTLRRHCLEPPNVGITGSVAGNDVPELNSEWISTVAEGATALFMEQLHGIHYITDRGALQLATDIEYLNNVLFELSMPIPPFLSAFHACISTPRDQVRGLIKSVAHLVSKIRRIPLD